jgi:hypothetical protein
MRTLIVELVHFADIAATLVQKSRHPGDNSTARFAGSFQNVLVFVLIHTVVEFVLTGADFSSGEISLLPGGLPAF